MKIIIGLGNIGEQYKNTRHNAGFMTIDFILKKLNLKLEKNDFISWYIKTKINNEVFIFAKPTTLMNLSGDCVKKILQNFNCKPNDLLIICDDLNQELGKFKISLNGSSGGYNGLKDIAIKINTESFVKFKIGISKPKTSSIIDYVLGKFTKEDINKLQLAFKKTYELIQLISKNSYQTAISKFSYI